MKLFSRVIGEGQPLIIIHGLFGMSDNWQALGKQFSEYFEVHLIDQRNHGRSPHSTVFDYAAMAADLVEYIEDNNLEKVLLMGHSLGGKTAMQLAVDYPAYIQKLIVVDIAPKYYPVHHDRIIAALQSLDLSQIKSRGEADKKLQAYIPEAGVRQFLLKSLYWIEKGQLSFRFNLADIAQNIEIVGAQLEEESAFDKPTLFVDGANSNYIQENDEDLIFSHFPQAEIATIPNAGHWVHAEQPKDFYETVMRFLF